MRNTILHLHDVPRFHCLTSQVPAAVKNGDDVDFLRRGPIDDPVVLENQFPNIDTTGFRNLSANLRMLGQHLDGAEYLLDEASRLVG